MLGIRLPIPRVNIVKRKHLKSLLVPSLPRVPRPKRRAATARKTSR